MSQTLKNVKYEDECYSIIFITVTSHTGETFSFLNQPNLRLEFFWNRWNPWKLILRPYTTHAFLVRAFSSNTESGMNFHPALHLCSFLNQEEARFFNAAYLLHYNKLYEEGDVQAINDLSMTFGQALQDMEDMREHWTSLCSQAANTIIDTGLFAEFGMKHPAAPLDKPWESDIIVDDFPFEICLDEEC